MASSELRLENLSFVWQDEVILKDVDLEIFKNEILVLMGPSGGGKTVLLKMMAGLLEPTHGNIWIGESNLLTSRGKEREQMMLKMGMLFQKSALFDSLSVFENVAFPLRELTSLSEVQVKEKVQKYLAAVGLSHAQDLWPDEISGGMQKRLGIARALALEPKILFLDDPTSGLDPITSRKIVELILQIHKENGCTVIAVTNDVNRAYQMADRMAFVFDQNLLLTGTIEQTKLHSDLRVQQFIKGQTHGPLSVMP